MRRLLLIFALSSLSAFADPKQPPASAIPATPAGTLVASPTVVQTGTKPVLNWNILYPSTVGDVAIITPPGTITLTQPVFVSVQPVGTKVTDCSKDAPLTPIPAEARMSINDASYFQLFYGTQTDVEPQYSLYTKKLSTNQVINFGGRYVKNGAWTPFFTTRSANMQVVTLRNGDIPPTAFPLAESSSLAAFLKPYLDSSGKVRIGPMSVIIMMELGQTDHSKPCFDCQDMVLLVTFSKKHPNNGHGNNLDGVDSSNPGKGGGGPNGQEDPSNGFDDEIR